MRIHVFQHVQYEDIGSIAEWIQKNDHKVNYSKFYENFKFPNIDDFDLLIVMGGPMSTSDDIKFPWLKEEKKFIKEAIEQGKYILGICLGAQLIAECLGSNVHHNKQKEIGWYSIRKSENSINNGLLPEILKLSTGTVILSIFPKMQFYSQVVRQLKTRHFCINIKLPDFNFIWKLRKKVCKAWFLMAKKN